MKLIYVKAIVCNRFFLQKNLIMAKLLIAFFFCTIVTTYANESYAQKEKVTLELKGVSLRSVIGEIKQQTGFEFAYDSELESIIFNQVSVNAYDENIEQILSKIFTGTGISYRVIDKIVLLSKKDVTTDRKSVV